jgi:hypothetical protein
MSTHDEATPEQPGSDELAAPATEFVRDRADYLGQKTRDVGRRIADDQVELFVSGDAVSALLHQFERLAPEFIALHDVGASASVRLLLALAAAAHTRVQRLTIRRQGHGVALAVLQFVEVPLADGAVRVYSTEADADTQTRQQLVPLLLSRSRLACLLVGELPPHALTTALQPLRDALARGPWPNRNMLLLPLGSATTLAAQAAQLVGASGVVVRVTPQAGRPNDAWGFISGAWKRMHGGAPTSGAMPLQPPAPPAMALQPTTLHGPLTATPAGHWTDYALRCAAIKGVVSCCVFDVASQRPLAHAGGAPAPERMALHGGLLLGAIADAGRGLGLGAAPPDAAISIGGLHLLLRQVPGHPGVVLHMLLQASTNNLVLARVQLERVPAP